LIARRYEESQNMTITVKILHCDWRDGRPRFNPSPALRRLGFARENLQTPTGRWMTHDEAEAWIGAKLAEAEQRRRNGTRSTPAPAAPGGRIRTVEDVFEDYWRSSAFASVAERTKVNYRSKARVLSHFDPELWVSPIEAFTRGVAIALYEAMFHKKGRHMANGMMSVMRLVFANAYDRERISVNPTERVKMKAADPRIRIATQDEINALMTVADRTDVELGDAIMIALYTGQRQADVLKLRDADIVDGRIRVRQNKTGARLAVRALPQLLDRVAMAKQRKALADFGHVETVVVNHAGDGCAFTSGRFRERMVTLKAEAAKVCKSVATLKFLDLRDTAITRLANAGCTIPQIAAISGHSLQSITNVLKHYLEANVEQADAATEKLAAWLEAQGIAL
jgi:integrase